MTESKIEQETKAVLDHLETVIKGDALKAENAATGYIKLHLAWVIGFCCFLLGAITGHVVK